MQEENLINYFAYGSNMSSKRLISRIPSAIAIGSAYLEKYRFVCNKRSKDGSAKGNIQQDENACVWGVVFQLPKDDLPCLDSNEKGYHRIIVPVSINHSIIECITYISQTITVEFPYGWYMNYLLSGALEFKLPDETIRELAQIPVKTEINGKTIVATYNEIQTWVKAQYGYIPKTCWIAHVKEISGLVVNRAVNRKGENRVNVCPQNRQMQIKAALEHFRMV